VVECCLERGADLHVAQLMPLPLTVSCFSKIQIGFTFLVPAHPGSPEKSAIKPVCVCVRVCLFSLSGVSSVLRSSDLAISCYRRSKQRRIGYQFLPARRYASAGTSYDPVSVSVSVSVTSRCCIKMNERISLLFGTQASFDQSYTVI